MVGGYATAATQREIDVGVGLGARSIEDVGVGRTAPVRAGRPRALSRWAEFEYHGGREEHCAWRVSRRATPDLAGRNYAT